MRLRGRSRIRGGLGGTSGYGPCERMGAMAAAAAARAGGRGEERR